MRSKGILSSQNLRVILLHAFHDPRLQNGGAAEIGNKVVWLFAGSGSLLIADSGMGGIGMQGTGTAGNNRKIHVEGEPPNIVRREIRWESRLLRDRLCHRCHSDYRDCDAACA